MAVTTAKVWYVGKSCSVRRKVRTVPLPKGTAEQCSKRRLRAVLPEAGGHDRSAYEAELREQRRLKDAQVAEAAR